jgi:EAL domain-containing protein (putative c-di-GMP-specific phosphodiesterase class I)
MTTPVDGEAQNERGAGVPTEQTEATPPSTSNAVVLRDADTAMYRAKASGRGRHEIFDAQMHVQAMRRLQQENDLRRALESREFTVHFQPIVELESRRVVGFEALSRWASPERGLVPPSEFIPVAEETGLIVQLDRGALLAACLQMSAWKREHPWARDLTLSVNLSTKHFAQPDVVEQVKRALQTSGLEARFLKLEITESAIMRQPERVEPTLRVLRDLQVQISLDDFGTGYSSLSYLHRFPLDTLKIDRSFVSRLGETNSEQDLGILQTIVSLARHLKMDVVAEGIETPAQAQCLLDLGCRHAQGYLFSRPISAPDVVVLLADASAHNAVALTD